MSNHIDPKMQEIIDRHAAATPGPWREYEKYCVKQEDGCYRSLEVGEGYCIEGEGGFGIDGFITPQDASFIAHAPEDIAYLLSQVEQLQAQVEQWKRASETHKNIHLARLSDQREMKKALEWYADKDNYDPAHLDALGRIPIDEDEGARARAALSHLKGE